MYCDYRDQSNQSIVHIVGSILHQLLNGADLLQFPIELNQQLEDITKKRSKPGLDDILNMVKCLLPQLKCAFVCIDGFDELEKNTRVRLFEVLKGLLGSNKISVFLTGRKHIQDEVRARLPVTRRSEIEIHASLEDIEKYVIQEINRDLDSEAMDQTLRRDILKKIIAQSNGM